MKTSKWALLVVAAFCAQASAKTFSVECVDNYKPCTGFKSLSDDNAECDDFENILRDAGHTVKWDWREGNVWGNDFRDSGPTEEYSDDADIFYYSGHGDSAGDEPSTCAKVSVGGNNIVHVSSQCRWGSSSPRKGKARWILLDASCSMQVVPNGSNNAIVAKLASGWLPAFNGLHLAVGSHCSPTGDIQDSEDRGEDFAEDLTDGDSYTDAWMDDGLIDVQDGACAVTMGGGTTFFTALNRMEVEGLGVSLPDASGKATFLAYSFVCQ